MPVLIEELNQSKSQNTGYKRSLDLFILLSTLLLLLPLWLLLAILIPTSIWIGDRGPIFFRQDRAGKNGEIFTLLKFRTMVPDSSTHGPVWTLTDDKRVTTVGKILRRTALDELPGLLSILKGDMSFVGPRALEVGEQKMLEKRIPEFRLRLNVVPGLTGLAQLYDQTDIAEDKIKYDLQYISTMSLWLDVMILIRSVKNTFLARWDRREGKDNPTANY